MANPCAGSTAPSLGTRSRTWPYEARTVKSLPRYLLIVLALAGDSTMRRFLAMGRQLPVQGWGRAVNGRPGWRLDGNARGGATGAGGDSLLFSGSMRHGPLSSFHSLQAVGR